MSKNEFYTQKGYDRISSSTLSPAMEDYLEMIYRETSDMNDKEEFIRVKHLASRLNVTPPSSSKMVNKLKEQGLVEFEPYGMIRLTKKGLELGGYLLHRHNILQQFFCLVNGSDSELELVERVDHAFDPDTVKNIETLLPCLESTAERLRHDP